MQLQSILNKVQKFKGYVYENVTLSQNSRRFDDHIRARKGASPTCSGVAAKTTCMTIVRKLGDSSSYRCGRLPCSSSTSCGVSIAATASE
jgi:hypothetical protein